MRRSPQILLPPQSSFSSEDFDSLPSPFIDTTSTINYRSIRESISERTTYRSKIKPQSKTYHSNISRAGHYSDHPGHRRPVTEQVTSSTMGATMSSAIRPKCEVSSSSLLRSIGDYIGITSPDPRSGPRQDPDGPPPGAPTAPAAMRCQYTHTRTWKSEHTRLKEDFRKCTTQIGRMHAGQSPSLPTTLQEFKELRTENVNRRARARAAAESMMLQSDFTRLMHGREFEDNLSPLFATNTLFNKRAGSEFFPDGWPEEVILRNQTRSQYSKRQGNWAPAPSVLMSHDEGEIWRSRHEVSVGDIACERNVVASYYDMIPVDHSEEASQDLEEIELGGVPKMMQDSILCMLDD